MTREHNEDGIRLIEGDCLDVMPTLEAGSIDLILADLPYGVTACKWDSVIPFEPLWACYKRLLKPRGAVVLTASQPFTSMLVMSNREWFKYEWIWHKNIATGFLDVNRRPMKSHESVLVFYSERGTYEAQDVRRRRNSHVGTDVYGEFGDEWVSEGEGWPKSVLAFGCDRGAGHPNQKPVALFEYLIRTYSNEGETVLDNTMGSGTTAIACLNTGRKCVGIERDPGYFDVAVKRCKEARLPLLT